MPEKKKRISSNTPFSGTVLSFSTGELRGMKKGGKEWEKRKIIIPYQFIHTKSFSLYSLSLFIRTKQRVG